ncbi:unnamed protein product [Schistosoma curassoni]|nr:unnamed protein product [Schistosoma curassoni]
MEWSDNLSIPTSALYLNLSSQIQYVVTKSVQLANVQISFSFKILNVTFEKVIVQIETVYRVNNTENYEYRLINSIFMKMTVEMRSLEASLLTDMELKQIFIEGLGKLNVTSGPNLVDIEFTQTSSSTTLTTQRSTSSEYKELTTQSKITLPVSTIPVVHNRTDDQFTRIHSTTTSKPQIDYPILCQISGLIYFSKSFQPIEWLDDLIDNSSEIYQNFSLDIQNQINNVMEILDLQFALSLKILNIKFTKIPITMQSMHDNNNNNNSSNNNNTTNLRNSTVTYNISSQISVTITLETKLLLPLPIPDNRMTEILNEGWKHLTIISQFILIDIQFSSISTDLKTTQTLPIMTITEKMKINQTTTLPMIKPTTDTTLNNLEGRL